eukprot:7084573-Lingulodinium_polyedra.AAC.1
MSLATPVRGCTHAPSAVLSCGLCSLLSLSHCTRGLSCSGSPTGSLSGQSSSGPTTSMPTLRSPASTHWLYLAYFFHNLASLAVSAKCNSTDAACV